MSLREALLKALAEKTFEEVRKRGRRAFLAARAAGQKEEADPRVMDLSDPSPPMSLRDQVQMYIRSEMSRHALAQGQGSFEDEDDFSFDGEDEVLLSAADVRMLDGEDSPAEGGPVQPATADGGPVPPSPKASGGEG